VNRLDVAVLAVLAYTVGLIATGLAIPRDTGFVALLGLGAVLLLLGVALLSDDG
jgi:hypothetical protein